MTGAAAARNESIENILDGTTIATANDGAIKNWEVADKIVPTGEDTGVGLESGYYTDVATRREHRSEESGGMSTPLASLGKSSVIRQSGDAEVAVPLASLGKSSVTRQSGDAEVSAPLASRGKSSVIHQSGDAEVAATLASLGRSSVVRQSGDAEVAEDDSEVEDKPELLYAVEFSAASARDGDETVRLLAEVNQRLAEMPPHHRNRDLSV